MVTPQDHNSLSEIEELRAEHLPDSPEIEKAFSTKVIKMIMLGDTAVGKSSIM